MNHFEEASKQCKQLKKIKSPAVKHYQQSLILKTLLDGLKGGK